MSDNGAAEQASDERSPLEREIDEEMRRVTSATVADEGRRDVALTFFALARSLAREGKAELATKKLKAARAVLTGVVDDE